MFKKLIAQLLAVAFVTGLFGSLAGCITMEGAGKDIEKAAGRCRAKPASIEIIRSSFSQ